MSEENTKKIVKVDVHLDAGKRISYEGRLLGLINDDEFHTLIKNKTVQGRCITKQTIPLTNITTAEEFGGYEGLKGLRLVVAVKKKEGLDSFTKMLFVSSKLSMISYVKKDNAAFNSNDGCWLTIEEKEV